MRNFIVAGGTTVRVQPHNGTNFGTLRVSATTSSRIEGTLSADLAGYPGGAGGTSDGSNESQGGSPGSGPGAGARGMSSRETNDKFNGRPGAAGGGAGRIKVFADVYNQGTIFVGGGAAGRAGSSGQGAPCEPSGSGERGGGGTSNVVESWSDPYSRSAPITLLLGTTDELSTQSMTLEPSRALAIPDAVPVHQGSLQATEELGLRVEVVLTTPTTSVTCNFSRNLELSDRLQLAECTGGFRAGDYLEVTQIVARFGPRLDDAVLFFRAEFLERVPMRLRPPPASKFITYADTSVPIIPGEYMVVFDGALVPEAASSARCPPTSTASTSGRRSRKTATTSSRRGSR